MIENFTLPRKKAKVPEKTERIFGLDLMRAGSILMVFLAHSMPLNPLDRYFPFGWLGLGVEAFFVLSGFLIGRIILRTVLQPGISLETVKVFWVNRWLRTLPAYFVALASYYYFYSDMRNIIYYVFFAQNIFTPAQGFFPHSWSLAVEEWFYITFPVALLGISALAGNRGGHRRIYLRGIMLFVALGLATKSVYHWMYHHDMFTYLLYENILMPSWKTFVPPSGDWDSMRKMVMFRIDAIAYGCLVAYALERYNLSYKTRVWLLGLGGVLLLLCFQVIEHTVAGSKINFFVDVLLLPMFCVTFALMLPFAVSCPRPGQFWVKIVTHVSLTSYSFYLMHFLVLDFAVKWYERNEAELSGWQWPVFLGSYFFIYLIAFFMYKFIELPFMNYRKKLFPNPVHISRS
ncbi:acyltransferase [Dyadobacter beijingensis]|uniref:Acyltransferase n=1 Tax=Dyadobacter beijingensis TaxID=365489 RepID=A0ABQ2HTE1_9BACT|nr:acyltransferase [Dyadobacter beijingensis]GGM89448.1 acyltransferase [Dyadobacter beijingensis]